MRNEPIMSQPPILNYRRVGTTRRSKPVLVRLCREFLWVSAFCSVVWIGLFNSATAGQDIFLIFVVWALAEILAFVGIILAAIALFNRPGKAAVICGALNVVVLIGGFVMPWLLRH